ncbi:putative nuclease HARBI1 [Chenopodium quinoa]|uniref:putative nuclease HARBI1 n=1 Tax=Chenopodium quinoa TaxID=63459 RepID=UPI000B7833CE|nr:putative nuclease HARBI1 [Chenopodium quinoa]
MNSNSLNESSTDFSSSSSNSDDEGRELRVQQRNEVCLMIQHVMHEYIPPIIQAVTQQRRRKSTEPRKDRRREEGHARLYNDYFAEVPVYPSSLFRRRFRMRKHVFERLLNAVTQHDPWFQQRRDAAGRLGLSPLQKCTAAVRQLAYGCASDACDEYVRISEATSRLALQKFTEGVINLFGDQYLRRPNITDMERLLRIGEERGFPGMIGSIDCMHWEWKNCPHAWKGQYQGREGVATLVLKAVADRDLWIWHSFFGMPGSCNDINVLRRSPVFEDVLEGRTPPVNFVVNGHHYTNGYYLTDGIYPRWASFVKSITSPQTRQDRLFAKHQEAARKDVERAFGVLQARFAIIKKPSLAWDTDILHNIMLACIIIHNMIVEDERETYQNNVNTNEFMNAGGNANEDTTEYRTDRIVDIGLYLSRRTEIEDQQTHLQLKNDLVEHIWNKFGNNENLGN